MQGKTSFFKRKDIGREMGKKKKREALIKYNASLVFASP